MKVVSSLAFALAAAVGAVSAFAADKAPADQLTPQQQKMSTCSKDAHAKSLKGDDYKSYMSNCIKGSDAAAGAAKPATSTTSKTAAATTASPPTNMTPAGDVSTSTTAADKKVAADKNAAGKTGDQQWVATPTGTSANPQQQKMKTCAADAKTKGLKGVDRRNYMSTCLKGDGTTTTTATPAAKKN